MQHAFLAVFTSLILIAAVTKGAERLGMPMQSIVDSIDHHGASALPEHPGVCK